MAGSAYFEGLQGTRLFDPQEEKEEQSGRLKQQAKEIARTAVADMKKGIEEVCIDPAEVGLRSNLLPQYRKEEIVVKPSVFFELRKLTDPERKELEQKINDILLSMFRPVEEKK